MDKLLNEYRGKIRDIRVFASRICYYGMRKEDLVPKYKRVIENLDDYLKNILQKESYEAKFDYIVKNGDEAIKKDFPFNYQLFEELKVNVQKEIENRFNYTIPTMESTSLEDSGHVDYNPKEFSDNISKDDSPLKEIKDDAEKDTLLRLYLNHLWFYGATKELLIYTSSLKEKIDKIQNEIKRKKELEEKAKQEREIKAWREKIKNEQKEKDKLTKKREQLETDIEKAKKAEKDKEEVLDKLKKDIEQDCMKKYHIEFTLNEK